MKWRPVSFLLASALLLLLSVLSLCGCARNYRAAYVYPPRRGVVAPPYDRYAANGPLPPRYAPSPPPGGATMTPPPGAVMSPPPGAAMTPPPGAMAPPPGAMVPSASPPPAADIQQNAYFPPRSSASSAPPAPAAASPGVHLQQPEPVAAEARKPMPPQTRADARQTPEPPPAPPRDERGASPSLPVDIPQFAMVKANIANGQEPFADGILWLKSHGYRTILHIRAPGEDDDAVRRQFEQNGLRYLSLEVSPRTLSEDIVDQFNRLVADANNLPLFVYDKDGSLAGALWYLHFRLADRAPDEKARAEAEHLGFRQDRGEAHLKMWIAVQKLLKDLKP